MNIPNILTLSRLLFPLIVILIHLFKLDKVSEQTLICIFFLAFGLTDYLDGVIARKYNLISKFGKIFDPVSDKVLTASALIYIISFEEKALTPSLLIITRELIVSGLREYTLAKSKKNINVIFLSKIKTALQFFSIILLLINDLIQNLYNISIFYFSLSCLWIAAILTLYTGFKYSYNVFSDNKKRN